MRNNAQSARATAGIHGAPVSRGTPHWEDVPRLSVADPLWQGRELPEIEEHFGRSPLYHGRSDRASGLHEAARARTLRLVPPSPCFTTLDASRNYACQRAVRLLGPCLDGVERCFSRNRVADVIRYMSGDRAELVTGLETVPGDPTRFTGPEATWP